MSGERFTNEDFERAVEAATMRFLDAGGYGHNEPIKHGGRARDAMADAIRVYLKAMGGCRGVAPETGEGRIRQLEKALAPFAGCGITDDGEPPGADYDWPPMRERIVDWFGPSDFAAARAALQTAQSPNPKSPQRQEAKHG